MNLRVVALRVPLHVSISTEQGVLLLVASFKTSSFRTHAMSVGLRGHIIRRCQSRDAL